MKAPRIEPDETALTLAELKTEYVAYLVESSFPEPGEFFEAEKILEKALFFRLSVLWMGGHNDCVFTLGSKNLSSH